MNNPNTPDGFFWTTCTVCGCQHVTDSDPVCPDAACQAYRQHQMDKALTVEEAERMLAGVTDEELEAAGL